ACYASPFSSQKGLVADILRVVRQTGAALIIPTVESTLVVLNEWREVVERHARLAAPPPEVLEYAINNGNTLPLARGLVVTGPRQRRAQEHPVRRAARGIHDRPATADRLARRGDGRVQVRPRRRPLHPDGDQRAVSGIHRALPRRGDQPPAPGRCAAWDRRPG